MKRRLFLKIYLTCTKHLIKFIQSFLDAIYWSGCVYRQYVYDTSYSNFQFEVILMMIHYPTPEIIAFPLKKCNAMIGCQIAVTLILIVMVNLSPQLKVLWSAPRSVLKVSYTLFYGVEGAYQRNSETRHKQTEARPQFFTDDICLCMIISSEKSTSWINIDLAIKWSVTVTNSVAPIKHIITI